MKKAIVLLTIILTLALATSVYSQTPILGTEICGVTYNCVPFVADGVCPEDYLTDSDCSPCDEDCEINNGGTCPATDCTISSALIKNDPDLMGDEYVELFATLQGGCSKTPDDFIIDVVSSSPILCPITQLIATNVENVGTHITGLWAYEGDLDPNCLGVTITAKNQNDAAFVNYTDGQTTTAKPTGHFTFHSSDPNSICKTECTTYPSCFSKLRGNIDDSDSSLPLEGVSVNLRSLDGSYNYLAYTDDTGYYDIEDIRSCDETIDYQLTASEYYHAPFIEKTKFKNRKVIWKDISLKPSTTTCQDDCSRTGIDICDRTCDGWKGCLFASEQMMDLCDPTADNPYDGVGVGQERTVSGNIKVRCCEGVPRTPSDSVSPKVKIDAENIIKSSRVVVIGGQQLEMHLIVFD